FFESAEQIPESGSPGDCVITVQLTEEDELEDDVDFYLVFTGSTVQHCTSTRKINPGTLETIAPGHDCCETVKVTLCASRKGLHHLVVAEGSFQFIQDEAYDAAQFLATCAGNQQALNFTRFLDRSRPPSGDVNFLDERVVLAFRHLKLPAEWNVLGTDQSLNESSPRETLMHFAVRLGLLRLTWFLLQQPGGRGALCIHNNEGATPVSLALERGYKTLHQLLTAEEAGEPDSWSTLSHVVHSGDYCVKYHRGLNVYTLTAEAKEGDNCNIGTEVDGYLAATAPILEEMPTEGSKEGPSALVNADVSQLSAPTCHEENKFESGSLESLNNTSKDLLSLAGTENPGCSCESKNTATLSKKEEEGPATVVDSRTLSDKNDCMLSRDTEADGAASFPSCGNTNEETGMTSTGVVLNQASLCSRDNTQQEAQIVEERATESAVTVAETAGKIPTPQEGVDVAMGQAECKNCTGTGDAASVRQSDGLSGGCASSQAVLKRESGSESELFPLAGDGMDDIIFGKHEEEQFACDVTSSSSSADDTVSLERNSSLGSDISLPHALNLNRPKERHGLDGSCINMAVAEGQESELGGSGEMEEELDSITEVPTHSSVLRNSMRPLSPFRRHSWGPGKNAANEAEINHRSYSLEGLAGDSDDNKKPSSNLETSSLSSRDLRRSPLTSDERGSLVSLTEEEVESEQGEMRGFEQQACQRSQPHGFNFCASAASPLTKSISLMTIIQPGLDTCPIHSPSPPLSEKSDHSSNFLPPSPSRKDLEGKSGTKVSRTFSYIKNKMSSSKKSKEKEKDKEKTKEKDKDSKEKEKDKKLLNGHLFSPTPTVGPVICYHCLNPFNKDSYLCANCNAIVHKGCKESLTSCAKVKMKFGWGFLSDVSLLASQPKERPRSAILAPDENTATSLFNNRRSQQNTALSKSVSIQNIAGVGNDENIIHTWKFLSQSTDSLHKISRVNESMESLTDEGADMNEGQLMGDFELDSKQLEAESWSQAVDKKFLQQQKKDVVKRQDVIYELMQTEMHHVRTLKIMSDVYSRGMMQELQFDQQMVEKVFPCLDDLLNIHNQFFQRILERKKESLRDKSEKNYVIKRIGDILVNQFSGENGERMKKTYGKFCGHHNEAVNYFKDLQAKEKRFQAFIKKKMSSTVVRRLGIPECILLVTQRITKYPVLLQTILQYTKENEVEHQDLTQSLNLVKDVIAAVNSKVSNYEKKTRLCEIYTRTDSKSIMRMKSGQMFAREDLRRRKLIRDGPVSLRNAAGRLKEVQAVLLSDMLIFLQEKDQKYVFASLDQKSTVISLKKLIVREVAHEEKGLFLITTVVKDPEMVEVHASSKEERNSWIQIIQDTINTMDKDEDEGIPSESELEKRVVDTKVRELKEQLQQKDQQIITLLEEKEKIFQDLTDCSMPEDGSVSRVLFRSNTEEAQKGEDIMKSAINEVEYLQSVISRNLGSALGAADLLPTSEQEGGVGPVFLPRRAETFGGFDSHQMNASKCGEKDEGDDTQDLRRTESDSILKKVPLLFFDCAFSEGRHCADFILASPQAVVLQQDTYIEDQKLVLSERALTRSSSRPNSLIEQEKQRSLEKQRQELANLQKQQAQHQEEKRRREKEWEAREKELTEREGRLAQREELAQKGNHDLEKEREELRRRKVAYQQDLEHLRAAQKQLEREKEQLRRDLERLPPMQMEPDLRQVANPHDKIVRSPSRPIAEDSRQHDSSFPKQGHLNAEQSLAPKRNSLTRTHKEKGTFQLLSTTNQTNKAAEGQQATRLFSLTKTKDKKEKKKKGKGHRSQPADAHSSEAPPEGEEIFC
uniref:A-kinase anchoring protein 13 n=1 Tax=Pelusios castaneus TaxID=367368 RepID=A0A8C8R8B0_9SAUR